MIKINGKEPKSILYMGRPVISVYINGLLMWPENEIPDIILSCFHNGYWDDRYHWTDELSWVD